MTPQGEPAVPSDDRPRRAADDESDRAGQARTSAAPDDVDRTSDAPDRVDRAGQARTSAAPDRADRAGQARTSAAPDESDRTGEVGTSAAADDVDRTSDAPDRADRAGGQASTRPGAGNARDLAGLRVLVPRGGPWGEAVAADLRARGAEPLVVPLIGFAPPEDPAALETALGRLRHGGFDWLVVTSATTVEVLVERGATVPPGTRVAAVGGATRAACERAGIAVDLVPEADHSALGLAGELPGDAGRVLLPQSDIADPGLGRALAARGADVTAVVAYRTVAVGMDDAARAAVRDGADAVLVTSGSVARSVAVQLGPLLPGTVVACLGPRTAADAAAAGLRVDVVAADRTVPALLDALAAHVAVGRPGTRGG